MNVLWCIATNDGQVQVYTTKPEVIRPDEMVCSLSSKYSFSKLQ